MPGSRRLGALTLLFLVTAMVFAVVQLAPEKDDALAPMVVEVRGDVARPGFHALSGSPTLSAALQKAGAANRATPGAVLEPGTRVVVEGDSVRLERMDDLLVVGLPIDLNTASAAALQAIPGLGPRRAQSIVADRTSSGPYESVDALERVQGVGPKTIEKLRPFVIATPVQPAVSRP